ncbi:predicted protein [Meyerozyma guilliermondii ATCC 6260]|uniref:Uncharacterized protein n=1 Tax=Meyerozyma guilliermondii (strain ATCC 6260 / CBS 566 / DSM 6381 / JCM 1539 / NBRC 10279 / NRRL Y-324) TaxID=294746 RepID=A5DKQ6_PICGU|nr:uncharacterized protein PGUG_03857 [Meyerozyma guilliermondii ATCC 6260]EDK39758.1 predicted protein [Meyerozyma guilliermondii ATCC 6260]
MRARCHTSRIAAAAQNKHQYYTYDTLMYTGSLSGFRLGDLSALGSSLCGLWLHNFGSLCSFRFRDWFGNFRCGFLSFFLSLFLHRLCILCSLGLLFRLHSLRLLRLWFCRLCLFRLLLCLWFRLGSLGGLRDFLGSSLWLHRLYRWWLCLDSLNSLLLLCRGSLLGLLWFSDLGGLGSNQFLCHFHGTRSALWLKEITSINTFSQRNIKERIKVVGRDVEVCLHVLL